MKSLFFLGYVVIMTVACETAEKEDAQKAPEIHGRMPAMEAVDAAIAYGGETLNSVKKLLTRQNSWDQAFPLLTRKLDNFDDLTDIQLVNSAHLYMVAPYGASPKVFLKLVRADRLLARRLGWHIASVMPSLEIKTAAEQVLTGAIIKGQETLVLLPQVASAAIANRLSETYTLMRKGLYETGDEAFVRAMISFRPTDSSDDLLEYLAGAGAEDLRQLTLTSVNVYSCILILKHFRSEPPSVSHSRFAHLFLYAVSRNNTLAELAQNVIETYVPKHTGFVAAVLGRQPTWVQIAFLENVRRHMTAKRGLLLGELKLATGERDVIDEINQLRR